MTILIATDKFKGSLSSFEAGNAIERGIRGSAPDVTTIVFPMADGGDGFSLVMQYYKNTMDVSCASLDPLHRKINANYQWESKNMLAIIEVAAASGLVLLTDKEKDPLKTSTRGTGLLIKHALDKGAKEILLGLGGSATNDAGMGILQELGYSFLDKSGKILDACGGSLSEIAEISVPARTPDIQFEMACDVENVLYGRNGAAWIYAAQKGANERSIQELDAGLRNFADVVKKETGKNIAEFPGSGAAGGIAAGIKAFFPVMISRGTDLVINASGINNKIKQADLLVTGEGKIDHQSNQGKVVGEMASLAAAYGVPCIAICGKLELNESEYKAIGLRKILSLDDGSEPIEDLMKNARERLVSLSQKLI